MQYLCILPDKAVMPLYKGGSVNSVTAKTHLFFHGVQIGSKSIQNYVIKQDIKVIIG